MVYVVIGLLAVIIGLVIWAFVERSHAAKAGQAAADARERLKQVTQHNADIIEKRQAVEGQLSYLRNKVEVLRSRVREGAPAEEVIKWAKEVFDSNDLFKP